MNMKRNATLTGDEDRLINNSSPEVRGDRTSSDTERTSDDGTVFTSEERRKMLRNEWVQTALPQPPSLPGFHMMWLSSNNGYDPIHKRLRMGYQLVKASEVGMFGDESMRPTAGEYAGCVSCNEMILAKIPLDLYNEIMHFFHHEMPLEEEQKIRENAAGNQRDSNGRLLGEIEGDGIKAMGKVLDRAPTFPT